VGVNRKFIGRSRSVCWW